MAINFKDEEEVKQYITNLGIEYRFGCYSEKNAEACHLLADYLDAIDKDFAKAAKVYKANCDEQNFPRSCYKYASVATLGKGCTRNFKEAYRYFEKACSLQHHESCFLQGFLAVANNEKHGIERNVLKGMELMEKACLAKNANGCYHASCLYMTGVLKSDVKAKDPAVLKDPNSYLMPKNMTKALKYAEEGCNLKNYYSCVNLSKMYSRGDGVEKNEELALKYKKIAKEMEDEWNNTKTLEFGQGIKN